MAMAAMTTDMTTQVSIPASPTPGRIATTSLRAPLLQNFYQGSFGYSGD
jgi:hypothetical protein